MVNERGHQLRNAIRLGNLQATQQLVEICPEAAEVRSRNLLGREGMNALSLAAGRGVPGAYMEALARPDVDVNAPLGSQPSYPGSIPGRLIRNPHTRGDTPLMQAVRNDNMPAVEALLATGRVDTEARNAAGDTVHSLLQTQIAHTTPNPLFRPPNFPRIAAMVQGARALAADAQMNAAAPRAESRAGLPEYGARGTLHVEDGTQVHPNAPPPPSYDGSQASNETIAEIPAGRPPRS